MHPAVRPHLFKSGVRPDFCRYIIDFPAGIMYNISTAFLTRVAGRKLTFPGGETIIGMYKEGLS